MSAEGRFGGKLVLATHNKGKLREMRDLLAPYGIEVVSVGELGLPVPAETGHMFWENAAIKARAAATATGEIALADDSGICVQALDGAPGLFSADWAVDGDFRPAMERVERELQRRGAVAPEQRRARFVSALVVAWPDGHEEIFEGRVPGSLVWPPRGDKGFGYDPIFVPDGLDRTFGEITPQEKNAYRHPDGRVEVLSHRARAFALLRERLLEKAAQASARQ